ncbi:MAG: hypothetical protein WA733_06945 [Methylocystis sp.]
MAEVVIAAPFRIPTRSRQQSRLERRQNMSVAERPRLSSITSEFWNPRAPRFIDGFDWRRWLSRLVESAPRAGCK